MIVNVINGQSSGISESTGPNVFEGMSLAEACGQLQANVSDILNEMNMGILLNEHMYLRENGEDIQYVNEADTKLKDRIGSAIDNIIKQVSQLWDKLVTWIQDRVEDARMAFARAGIDKKKAEAAKSGSVDKCHVKWVGSDKVDNLIKLINAGDGNNLDEIDKKDYNISDWTETKDKLTSGEITDAYNTVFDTNRTVLGKVRAAKKAAIDELNKQKKAATSSNSDDKADQIKSINANSRKISKISSFAMKVYHTHVEGSIQALKAAVKPEKAAKAVDRAAKVEETKDKIKSKMPKFGKKSDKEATSESAIFNDDRFFKV